MYKEITSDGKPFVHYHTAHCESGVTAALLRNLGMDISETLIFGIGSGIFFGYIFFIKLLGLPVTTYRIQPGAIFRKAVKRLGVKFVSRSYNNAGKGMGELRGLLKEGKIVGLTVNIYWLSYFPGRFRFQFGGHNLIVLREVEGGFRVSDPVLDHPVDCLSGDLERARFARGPAEPKGRMYYPLAVPVNPDIRRACIKGIKDTCNMMLNIPIPIFGVRGIRFLAERIKNSQQRLGFDEACRQLGNIVRMQEEIGTGGAGFRFMYAAFIQEAGEIFKSDELAQLSSEMTSIGDLWREFAVLSSRIIKQRGKTEISFDKVGEVLLECSNREKTFFKRLKEISGNLKI